MGGGDPCFRLIILVNHFLVVFPPLCFGWLIERKKEIKLLWMGFLVQMKGWSQNAVNFFKFSLENYPVLAKILLTRFIINLRWNGALCPLIVR